MGRRIHMVGNWKMNQSHEEIQTFFEELSKADKPYNCETWITPQFVHIHMLQQKASGLKNMDIKVGAQNCSAHAKGAFTGDISPLALKEMNTDYVLIGHSERRSIFGETHQDLNQKTKLALETGLKVIFCIGETLEERESGKMNDILKEQVLEGLKGLPANQLENVIIAYEPVWAIGTGVTASPEQAQEAHAYVRSLLPEVKMNKDETIILYGGSVNPKNVEGLLAKEDIDGGLVGGASLKAEDFLSLCAAASEA